MHYTHKKLCVGPPGPAVWCTGQLWLGHRRGIFSRVLFSFIAPHVYKNSAHASENLHEIQIYRVVFFAACAGAPRASSSAGSTTHLLRIVAVHMGLGGGLVIKFIELINFIRKRKAHALHFQPINRGLIQNNRSATLTTRILRKIAPCCCWFAPGGKMWSKGHTQDLFVVKYRGIGGKKTVVSTRIRID